MSEYFREIILNLGLKEIMIMKKKKAKIQLSRCAFDNDLWQQVIFRMSTFQLTLNLADKSLKPDITKDWTSDIKNVTNIIFGMYI